MIITFGTYNDALKIMLRIWSKSIFKGVLNLVYMAVTVTHLVQHTVQKTHVYYTMEPVYHVNLAGEVQFVQCVSFLLIN